MSSDKKKAEAAGMFWRSTQAEGNTRLDVLMYQRHFMYVKIIKPLFKEFQSLKRKRCFPTSVLLRNMKKSRTVILFLTCGNAVFMNHKKYF